MNDLHINGEYQREPWGYLGMTVRIYRAKADGSLYAMRDARGVIATARTMDVLADLTGRERWVATYRHVVADGRETWVSIPE
jgi:hypothetical protein